MYRPFWVVALFKGLTPKPNNCGGAERNLMLNQEADIIKIAMITSTKKLIVKRKCY
jgi:hypothetical protein